MSCVETKRHILSFMYAERLKSALIVAGEMLDVLAELGESERYGGLRMLGAFIRGVGAEMRLAANVMGEQDWEGLSSTLDLMEGYARLGQIDSARHELSHTLSRVTTLGGRALTSLERLGLL